MAKSEKTLHVDTEVDSFSNFQSYFMPWRCKADRKKQSHLENSGFLQIIFYTWLFPVIRKGMKKTLEQEDLGEISDGLSVNFSLKKFKQCLENERNQVKNDHKISLLRVYLNFVKTKFVFVLIVGLTSLFADFVLAGIALPRLLKFLSSPDAAKEDGTEVAAFFLSFAVVRGLTENHYMFLSTRVGAYAKTAVTALIYEKSIKLKSVGNKSVGELVNMCANDSQRIFDCSFFLVQLVLIPIGITLKGGYLIYYFGISSLASVGLVLLNIPLQIYLGHVFTKLREKTVKITDKRVKMTSEVFNSIKLIKMYAWEKPFKKIIYGLRAQERFIIQKIAFLQGSSFTLGNILGILMPAVAFLIHIFSGRDLNVEKAYTTMAILNELSFFALLAPMAIRGLAEAHVSFKRLESLLNMKERTTPSSDFHDPENLVEIKEANLSWEKVILENKTKEASDLEENNEVSFKPDNEKDVLVSNPDKTQMEELIPTLHHIDLCVKKNSLIGICGSVGSGKSSLLQALLGEMVITDGSIAVSDNIAYVPQQAWILNDTVRENILFGEEYEEAFYEDVCSACALDDDLKIMISGDLTEIGERGINLSGGQKQRISLARAVYAEKELYLLDDPLSAVDAHVGKHIFENCIKSALRKCTVVFVTHQLQYLKDCDYVYYMKEGFIAEQGTYEKLMTDDQDFGSDVKKFHQEHKEEMKDDDDSHLEFSNKLLSAVVANSLQSIQRSHTSLHDAISFTELEEERQEVKLTQQGKLVTEEEKEEGSVSWATYFAFCKYAGGAIPMFFVFFFVIGSVGLNLFADYWLSLWLNLKANSALMNVTGGNSSSLLVKYVDTDFYMGVYGGAAVGILILSIIATFMTVYVVLYGSTQMHNAVFEKLLGSPMAFFDTTPLGRILNRLSKDIDDIDNNLPWMFENCLRYLVRVIGIFTFVIIVFPWLVIAMVPVAIFLVLISFVYRKVVRAIKRIENVNRSPVLSHVSTTVQGLPLVHAYRKEKQMVQLFHKLLNANSLSTYLFNSTSRWFGFYTDLLCLSILTAVTICAIQMKDTIAPSLAGLALHYCISILGLFQFALRLIVQVESKFTCVERLNHYAKNLEQEGIDELQDGALTENWPENGNIQFENVSVRYRDGLPLVLKNLTLEIKDKEKIGIAGRTGAGKSSIAVALYRIVNLEGGVIRIAGRDIASLGLTDLRSKLSIIPQDPVLFIGSIRYNLDPFEEHEDEELWSALEKAHIKNMIIDLPGKLESPVLENGSNFSVGERQLICMARASLRKSKILILDEATASIDSKTDSKIQETIKESFSDCTVLTVAHRLNTIMHCDKILVMDKGEVAEFESPSMLLGKEHSLFKEMVLSANTRLKQ